MRLLACLMFSAVAVGAPTWLPAQVAFQFRAPETQVAPIPGQPTTFTVSYEIVQTSGPLADTQGFSMGVAHPINALEVDAIEYGAGVLSDEWGEPTFFGTDAYADGWSCGVVYAFLGNWWVEFPEPLPVVDITYTLPAEPTLPAEEVVIPLTFVNTLGTPSVNNVVVYQGQSYPVDYIHGSVSYGQLPYIRGDMNGDGTINIADVFTAESYLFLQGETPACLAALDTNADLQINIADIISLLTYLFLQGATPPEPFSTCGPEPQSSSFGCTIYQCP